MARIGFHILFWSALVIGVERGDDVTGAGALGDGALAPLSPTEELATGERAFRDLEAADQRMFRQIQEGVTEAEIVRGATQTWPTVEALAAEGIPPFARDPIEKTPYSWTMLRKGALVNYVGTPPVASGRHGFVVLILEPEPGMPADPQAVPDEIHHQLSDGTMLHVSIWMGPGLRDLTEPVPRVPVEEGWRRVAVTPGTNVGTN